MSLPSGEESKSEVPQGEYINAWQWLCGIIRATMRARPVQRIWEWIDAGNVSIPLIVGSPNPGPLKTDRFPIYRGLYDLVQRPGVHFFTFCSSVRTGKTLLSICIVLWWIGEKCGGPVLWLDPTRKSALKFSRTELDPFIRECAPAWEKAIVSKTTWTALEKFFRGCFLRLVGSGAEADLHGFQAELVVLNESVRLRASIEKDATSADKAIARSNHPFGRNISGGGRYLSAHVKSVRFQYLRRIFLRAHSPVGLILRQKAPIATPSPCDHIEGIRLRPASSWSKICVLS